MTEQASQAASDHAIDFNEPAVVACPYPALEEARRAGRVTPVVGQNTVVLTHDEDVRSACKNPAVFSSRGSRQSLSAGGPEFEAIAAQGYPEAPILITNDPPDHTRYRKLINRRFSNRSVALLEPRLREIVDSLIDDFIDRGSADLVQDFAIPFPLRVFGELVGAPPEDQAHFRRWADSIADLTSSFISHERALECRRNIVELHHYIAAQVEDRRASPRDDLISELATARVDGDRLLDIPELIDLLRVLLAGGVETTASTITTAMFLLLTHPDQMEEVRRDHGLIPQMVEESLRFEAPAQWNPRRAAEDVMVGDILIPEGTRVMMSWAGANRDPARYGADADQFIVRRGTTDHVAFGAGAHFCPGAPLGRVEARVAFEQLFGRLEEIELAVPAAEVRYSGAFIRRVEALPIRFTAKTG